MKPLYLDAGAFRDWLTLQENDQVEDGYGGYLNVWNIVSQCWAHIMPAQASFSIRAEINEANYTHIIDIRQPTNAADTMRFVTQDNARHFTILAAYDPDETGRYLRCVCRLESGDA